MKSRARKPRRKHPSPPTTPPFPVEQYEGMATTLAYQQLARFSELPEVGVDDLRQIALLAAFQAWPEACERKVPSLVRAFVSYRMRSRIIDHHRSKKADLARVNVVTGRTPYLTEEERGQEEDRKEAQQAGQAKNRTQGRRSTPSSSPASSDKSDTEAAKFPSFDAYQYLADQVSRSVGPSRHRRGRVQKGKGVA